MPSRTQPVLYTGWALLQNHTDAVATAQNPMGFTQQSKRLSDANAPTQDLRPLFAKKRELEKYRRTCVGH